MAALTDSVVKAELDQLDRFPVSDEERNTEDDASPIEMTEDWVRLYVALRRGSGSQSMRFSAGHLRRWRARVSSSTIVKRKVFIVKTAALLELPTYPEDLQRWVIPRGELELPADIYGDDVVFIDDGYDRSKLNVPGLLHLEVAVRWAREHSSAPTTGSSGDGLPRDGEDDRGTAAPAAELPEPPAAAAPAAELPAPPAAAAPAAERPAAAAPEACELEEAMTNIVAQTMKAVGQGRWVSNDTSLPNTAEFWVRLFANEFTKGPKEEVKLTETQKGYVMLITKALYESEGGYTSLPAMVPHFLRMQQWCSAIVPPLATVFIKLFEVDFEKPETETNFHTWLQKDFSLTQVQTVYNSVMYAGFLKKRIAAKLRKAQEDKTARQTLLPLLQESVDSVELAAELKVVATLDSTSVQQKQKLHLLWSTRNAKQIISKWTGLSHWSTLMRATGKAFLALAFHEKIVARAGASAAAEVFGLPEDIDIDISDCKEVAKELCRQWVAATNRPLKRAKSDTGANDPQSALAAAPAAAGALAAPAVAGASAAPAATGASSALTGSGAAEDQTPEEVGASAAPATSATDNSNEKGGETIKDMPTATEDKTTAKVGAAAAPADGVKDQGGNLLEPDAIVIWNVKGNMSRFRLNFQARIIRVSPHYVYLSILDGPMKGEKRRAWPSSVSVVSPPAKQAKLRLVPTARATGEALAASAAGEATKPVLCRVSGPRCRSSG